MDVSCLNFFPHRGRERGRERKILRMQISFPDFIFFPVDTRHESMPKGSQDSEAFEFWLVQKVLVSITTILVKQTNPQKINMIDSSPCVFSNWTRLLKSFLLFLCSYMPFLISQFTLIKSVNLIKTEIDILVHWFAIHQPVFCLHPETCEYLLALIPHNTQSTVHHQSINASPDQQFIVILQVRVINGSTVRSLLLIIKTQSTQSSVQFNSKYTIIGSELNRWLCTLSSDD